MVVVSWIVLILNALTGLKLIKDTFVEKTIGKRIGSFIGLIVNILVIWLCVYVIRL